MRDPGDYYLSLGAGDNQLPLIRAAKKYGLQVIGVDRQLEAVGLPECDIRIQESITNYRKILYKVDLAVPESQIAGGYAASYGAALLSWAYLAERWNLVGLSRTLTEVMLDKYEVRNRLRDAEHFSQPRYLVLENRITRDQIESIGFPMIVKTRDGAGKHHVYYMEKYSEIRSLLTRKNLAELGLEPRQLLLEGFVGGDEIIVTGMVQNFKFHLLSISDKITSDQPPFIDLEHRFPSKYQHLTQKIIAAHQEIADRFRLPATPLVSEFKVTGDDLYLIEVSPQIPGEYLASFLLPQVLEIDYYQLLLRLSLNEPIAPSKTPVQMKKAVIRYIPEAVAVDEWERLSEGAAFSRVLNRKPARPPRSNADRFGVICRIG